MNENIKQITTGELVKQLEKFIIKIIDLCSVDT